MPKSIFEQGQVRDRAPLPFEPDNWTYIGDVVQSNAEGSVEFAKVPVWNFVNRSWWQLNSDVITLDYTLRDITFQSAVLDVINEDDIEFGQFELTVTPDGSTIELPDDTDTYKITGLEDDTEYTVELRVWKIFDQKWSDWSVQTFRTLDNPVPLAPLRLRATTIKNTYVDLAWDVPPGTSSTSYNLYRGTANQASPGVFQKNVTGTTARLVLPQEDQKYFFYVAGVNDTGLEGPKSNRLQWATGHGEVRRKGSATEPLHPLEWGSWRNDIGWCDWHYWPTRVNQDSVFQGFWINDGRRYRGCITYKQTDFRSRMNSKYGANSWKNLNVEAVSIRRVYRMRYPGNAAPQWMYWHLTNTNVFNSGAPPVYYNHINNANNPDSNAGHYAMAAGTYHDWLRLPRGFGKALITGSAGGTALNGLMMYRGDSSYNGYGYGGYGEWCGHLQRDRELSDKWRYSDWTVYIKGSWNFVVSPYKAPYQW